MHCECHVYRRAYNFHSDKRTSNTNKGVGDRNKRTIVRLRVERQKDNKTDKRVCDKKSTLQISAHCEKEGRIVQFRTERSVNVYVWGLSLLIPLIGLV
jgi:hypothetical protein